MGITPHKTQKRAITEDPNLDNNTARQWPNEGPVDDPSMDPSCLQVQDSLDQPTKPPSMGHGVTNGRRWSRRFVPVFFLLSVMLGVKLGFHPMSF